ncbi:hypothetical protein [Rhizorhapis suberifaciens]|uniref:Uncharacterized protein n=1 Tax=Rhizorhapis suberifaciens TaxID=13656 RepID=A0A840HSD9_9SPHN|nr:hypothetical protein [Rhizorhapis suberifaciens]MBB4640843.1 hypothetical protein [Rhizorhapis suberifaciens]
MAALFGRTVQAVTLIKANPLSPPSRTPREGSARATDGQKSLVKALAVN